MKELMPLADIDIERSVQDLSSSLQDVNLSEYAHEVLRTLEKKELEVRSNDQHYYTMQIMPYRTVNNVIDGVVITFTDITERKQMQDELQAVHEGLQQRMEATTIELTQETADRRLAEGGLTQQQNLLEKVIQASTEGITVSNGEGQYVLYNRRMSEITGYTQEEAGRADFPALLYPDPSARKKAEEAIAGALSGTDAINQPWEMTRKDGQKRTVLISTRLIEHAGGKWLLGMVRDISED